MFTMPAAGGSGIILVARPSASTGTITNPANAYDLPSSRDDDYPYTTSADRAEVTGSTAAGTPDFVTVEYNTFPSRSKTTFNECRLSVGVNVNLSAASVNVTGFVTSSVDVDYQVDGSNWVRLKRYTVIYNSADLGQAANFSWAANSGSPYIYSQVGPIETLSVIIPSSSFPSDLNSLKIRFVLGTCTSNTVPAPKSAGAYHVWDIRANLS